MAAGTVLLLSGFLKALDAAGFARTLTFYGHDALRLAAPVIILVELFLGLSLLLGFRLRRTGAVATLFLLGVTAVFACGSLFRGVDDCGCFGAGSPLNGSPAVTFLRNGALLCLTTAVWRGGDNSGGHPFSRLLLLGGMSLGAFMTGYTYRTQTGTPVRFEAVSEPFSRSSLAEFFTPSADSAYLVFAFSYTCPHCLNSIENLKRYEPEGVVDRVVALALENPAAERRFREIFQPEFRVRSLPAQELFRLTNVFPTAYYVRGDTVRAVLSGEMPAACLFGQAFVTGTE